MLKISVWDSKELYAALEKMTGAQIPDWVKGKNYLQCKFIKMKDKRGIFLALQFFDAPEGEKDRVRVKTRPYNVEYIGKEFELYADMCGWQDCHLSEIFKLNMILYNREKNPPEPPDLWEKI